MKKYVVIIHDFTNGSVVFHRFTKFEEADAFYTQQRQMHGENADVYLDSCDEKH